MANTKLLLRKALVKWYILMALYTKEAGKMTRRKIREGCSTTYQATFTPATIMTANAMAAAECIMLRVRRYMTVCGRTIDGKARA